VGPVYPKDALPKDYLSYYSKDFDFVELNFSYYAQPKALMIKSLLNRTGKDFIFCIKAHQTLTHRIQSTLELDAQQFIRGIDPLMNSSRLAAILFQFPYSFHYTTENRKHMDKLCQLFKGFPMAVEFRNTDWEKDSVIEAFREKEVCYVNVDEPPLPKLPKPDSRVTSSFSYIRLHGRNKKNWWKGDNTSRYDYLYTDEELSDWIDRIKEIVQKVKILMIAFNNHFKGQAVKNARQLKEILKT
jgi:uncharacterized protein YecE (DUF72 family)